MSFKKHQYQVVKNLISFNTIQYLKTYCEIFESSQYVEKPKTKENPFPFETPNVEKSFNWYGGFHTETLCKSYKQKISKIVQKELAESYSYHRTYYKGSKLLYHVDRESCEYSASICIARDEVEWPLYIKLKNETIGIVMNEGDAVIYQGTLLPHWRDEFQGEKHTQFFLHYVDKNNIYYGQFSLDGRKNLGSDNFERRNNYDE